MASPIDPELLEICAARSPSTIPTGATIRSAGAGQGSWLVCADSGYKYPIRNGIPVMLVEEGEKWKDTAVDALPVPPPEAVMNRLRDECLSKTVVMAGSSLPESRILRACVT
ncbi:MAG: hypothetical protein U0521_20360 [Anaerolineae bacterium]